MPLHNVALVLPYGCLGTMAVDAASEGELVPQPVAMLKTEVAPGLTIGGPGRFGGDRFVTTLAGIVDVNGGRDGRHYSPLPAGHSPISRATGGGTPE